MMVSASPTLDMTTTPMATTTARRSPRRLATTSPSLLLSSPLLMSSTPSPSRPVSTSPLTYSGSLARISLRRSASPSLSWCYGIELEEKCINLLTFPNCQGFELTQPEQVGLGVQKESCYFGGGKFEQTEILRCKPQQFLRAKFLTSQKLPGGWSLVFSK